MVPDVPCWAPKFGQVSHDDRVLEPRTFIDAVKLADQLRHRGPLRLLAVVSDGDLDDIDPAQRLISTLHRSGRAVLWLRPADLPGHTFNETTTITVNDPVEAISHIAHAATTAVEHA
jgi:SpoVK/Ycf46/Vps4 family AAA+-type ATPase